MPDVINVRVKIEPPEENTESNNDEETSELTRKSIEKNTLIDQLVTAKATNNKTFYALQKTKEKLSATENERDNAVNQLKTAHLQLKELQSENLLLKGRIKQLELGMKMNKDAENRASHEQNRTANESVNDGNVERKPRTKPRNEKRSLNENVNNRKIEMKSKTKPRVQKRISREFEVEKILSHKNTKKTRSFYVKWLNYDASHNSWVIEKNLNCPTLLSEYLKSFE